MASNWWKKKRDDAEEEFADDPQAKSTWNNLEKELERVSYLFNAVETCVALVKSGNVNAMQQINPMMETVYERFRPELERYYPITMQDIDLLFGVSKILKQRIAQFLNKGEIPSRSEDVNLFIESIELIWRKLNEVKSMMGLGIVLKKAPNMRERMDNALE